MACFGFARSLKPYIKLLPTTGSRIRPHPTLMRGNVFCLRVALSLPAVLWQLETWIFFSVALFYVLVKCKKQIPKLVREIVSILDLTWAP